LGTTTHGTVGTEGQTGTVSEDGTAGTQLILVTQVGITVGTIHTDTTLSIILHTEDSMEPQTMAMLTALLQDMAMFTTTIIITPITATRMAATMDLEQGQTLDLLQVEQL